MDIMTASAFAAASALLPHNPDEQKHLAGAHECGIMDPLRKLALNGSERGKRKAAQLLERIVRFLDQQQEEEREGKLLASGGNSSFGDCDMSSLQYH
ncbi:hypothetical protein PR202_ga04380 [Eleusine coracana subsp. coracana]|uniref:Uncharacterized protein n=1 Tax=Eleusine coracana subsp. coracana TaxID=191504 RepID=A0AAV5BRH5_ELECO|nr:hypothetical protein PR202_ga04380 [Eleusine coracana subsp. coracana]